MKKNRFIQFGIILILLSGVAFAIMLLIPFLNMENKYKVLGSTSAIVAMEILFWTGSLLVGKQLISKYKSYLDPKRWIEKIKRKLMN